MRLLLVSQDFPPSSGGIQTYAYEVARRMAERYPAFAAIVPGGQFRRRPEWQRSVFRLPVRPDALPLAALLVLPLLASVRKFDVVLHTQWQTAIASIVSRLLIGYPRKIVVVAHGRELKYTPTRIVNWIRPMVLRRVDHFVPVSKFTARLLREYRVPFSRITVISNGTDPDRFYPSDASAEKRSMGLQDKKVILTVSRLVRHKGIDTTIRALRLMTDEFPQLHYVVAGTGPDRERLESLALQAGLSEYVSFVDRIPAEDLRSLYNVCDVFVLASREEGPDVEGFGIVFLEASACGKPVVAGRSGGTEDAVLAGETGLLVPPEDEEALAEAITSLLRDSEFRTRLGAQGRARIVAHSNWNHVVSELANVLESVAA